MKTRQRFWWEHWMCNFFRRNKTTTICFWTHAINHKHCITYFISKQSGWWCILTLIHCYFMVHWSTWSGLNRAFLESPTQFHVASCSTSTEVWETLACVIMEMKIHTCEKNWKKKGDRVTSNIRSKNSYKQLNNSYYLLYYNIIITIIIVSDVHATTYLHVVCYMIYNMHKDVRE